jgi:hypothetical protein
LRRYNLAVETAQDRINRAIDDSPLKDSWFEQFVSDITNGWKGFLSGLEHGLDDLDKFLSDNWDYIISIMGILACAVAPEIAIAITLVVSASITIPNVVKDIHSGNMAGAGIDLLFGALAVIPGVGEGAEFESAVGKEATNSIIKALLSSPVKSVGEWADAAADPIGHFSEREISKAVVRFSETEGSELFESTEEKIIRVTRKKLISKTGSKIIEDFTKSIGANITPKEWLKEMGKQNNKAKPAVAY